MAKKSAGLLVYRLKNGFLEVFIVHPGGPFWKKKDEGAWSIPKGEYSENEEPFETAKREFQEETSFNLTTVAESNEFKALTMLKQPSGKKIIAWAVEGDCDADKIKSNLFSMQWPPRSGKMAEFPEVDRASWFPVKTALKKLLKGQVKFVTELCEILSYDYSNDPDVTVNKPKQLSLFFN